MYRIKKDTRRSRSRGFANKLLELGNKETLTPQAYDEEFLASDELIV
jgi:hypothetical protein